MKNKKILLVSAVTFLMSLNSYAQNDAAELAKKLANPVASLISVPFQNNMDHGIGTLKGSRYVLNIQPVIPISLSKKMNLITRWIVPIVSQHNITGYGKTQSGLGDAVISGFLSPKNSKNGFTWGAGPVILLPIGGAGLTADQFGIGPSIVALKQTGGWTYGGLVNQIWGSGKGLSQFYINPFVAYNWKTGAGITAQLDWTHSWNTGKSNVFLIPMFSGLTSFGKQKVSLSVGPKFNIAAPGDVKSKFGIRAGLSLIFPK
ncbi:MAG: hypothetical protein RL172_1955 [Bacteroidota bacterium]|jgi:hypothetical protein